MKHLRTTITLLLLAAFSVALHLSVEGQVIQNDVFWHDTNGNPIYSQGGGVLKVGDTYYWYGAKYNGAITYYNDPYSGKNGDTEFLAITCYSSTDLANWTYEGDVMTPADGLQAGWVGRIGCAYNEPTGKYVLIAQMYPGLAFGTSDTPTGPFTLAATQSTIDNVVNDMTGDQSVFTDDDGQAYLAFCNVEGRNNQYISRLRPSDYLYVEPATRIHRASSGREGNVLFKHNGTYYFISSDLHGWNTSQTYCITATNILGPYSNEFVIQGTQDDYSHVTQSGLAVTVNGSSGSFVIFGGDRWADFAGNGVGYNQWCPISFNGSTPIFHSLSQWNINASAGTWSVGSGNNYVLNPNFEADRIDVTNMRGWTNWVGSGSNPNGNLQSSHFPGRFCLEQWSSGAYEASIFQDISLPNGTYELTAWVRSSGGQNASRIYVKDFGGSEKTYSINQSLSSWTEITIPDINVTNGSIEVGVYSNANGGNWVNVDDFSLVQTSSDCNPTSITPYVQVNGGSWQETSSVTVNSGDQVVFGPQPVSGGSWSWSGCGTSGSSREQTIFPTSSCTATATYTNDCGAQSSQAFNVTVGGQPGTGVWLESECGSVGSLWNTSSSSSASNGQYVTIQSGNNSTGSAPGSTSGHINYTFDISSGGDYTLWARVIAPTPNDDSFWIRMDGGSWTNWNNIAPGTTSWTWDDVTTYNLSSGSHTLTIAYREDGTQLDKLYLTSSGSPSGTGGDAFNCTSDPSDYVQFQNRGTGLRLDGLGRTTNGDACGQYANTTHVNSHWELVDVGSGYYQLQNRGTGLYLDGMGRTTNGADCGQWANTTHQNSHWSIQQYDGSYYRIQNRGTGLYLDGLGHTGNGDPVGQWANTTSQNAQWQMISVSSGSREVDEVAEVLEEPKTILFYPNPINEVLNIRLEDNNGSAVARILNVSGQVVLSKKLTGLDNQIKVQKLPSGIYFVEVTTSSGIKKSKLIKE